MSLSHHPPRTPAMLWAIDVNHDEGERCCKSKDARDARDARDEMDARDADVSARCGRFTPSLGRVNSHERPNLVVGAPEPTAVRGSPNSGPHRSSGRQHCGQVHKYTSQCASRQRHV